RRWHDAWRQTASLLLKECVGFRGAMNTSPPQRANYDANKAGDVAPHLDVVSVRSLRAMCRRFSNFTAVRENIMQEWPFKGRARRELLKTIWPRMGGLDIYVTCIK